MPEKSHNRTQQDDWKPFEDEPYDASKSFAVFCWGSSMLIAALSVAGDWRFAAVYSIFVFGALGCSAYFDYGFTVVGWRTETNDE
jgi:hypothetical protein